MSVVICTVKRPELLRKAVASVLRQQVREGLDYEIVVVDNSTEGLWRSLVAELADGAGRPLRYVSERRMSFARARNAGIRAARGDCIAFLDDDEEASLDWLGELEQALQRFDADVVFGPVIPTFKGGRGPSWDPDGRHHVRNLDVPSGTEVGARGTGNVMIRRATCLQDDEPFDLSFGASGGEDIDLFMRLRRQGRKLVWCATAGVTEFQPDDSLSLSHRGFRVFCLSQTYTKVKARNAERPVLTMAYLMAVGAAQVLLFALPGAASWLLPSQSLIGARLKLCAGLGKLLWMLPARLYAGRYGQAPKSEQQTRPQATPDGHEQGDIVPMTADAHRRHARPRVSTGPGSGSGSGSAAKQVAR